MEEEKVLGPNTTASEISAGDSFASPTEARIVLTLQDPDYVLSRTKSEQPWVMFVREAPGDCDCVLVVPNTRDPEAMNHMVQDAWLGRSSAEVAALLSETLGPNRAEVYRRPVGGAQQPPASGLNAVPRTR